MAYVTTLEATPRFTALFGGPLAFASVDLEDASLNLTRVDSGPGDFRWNFAALLQPQFARRVPEHPHAGRPDQLQIRRREIAVLSFEYGRGFVAAGLLQKTRGTLRVHAEPARTDRRARGFGSFMLRGQWQQANGATTLDVKLEQSELGDMLTLFNGYESGLNGHIPRVTLTSPARSRASVCGRAAEDLEPPRLEPDAWRQ